MSQILLTGGAGFIGSHTAVELLEAGEEVVIADDLSNSRAGVLEQIQAITGRPVGFYEANAANPAAMERIFAENQIETVIHFAGYKSVGESIEKPVAYYRNNLDTTLTLLETMQKYHVKRLVFSSSAAVYGLSERVPFTEDMPTPGCTNPYGWTKYMIERILTDAAAADQELSVVLLRYFNPIGAHESGLIGENPSESQNNLMSYITQVAAGIRKQLSVYGGDYPTPDGTGVRDYVHVVDLAKGHVAAVRRASRHTGVEIFNLGAGRGYSVLEVVHAFEQANHVRIPYVIAPRRAGDIAACYAGTEKAKQILDWQAEKSLEDMCRDSWRWQQRCCKTAGERA